MVLKCLNNKENFQEILKDISSNRNISYNRIIGKKSSLMGYFNKNKVFEILKTATDITVVIY